MDRAVRSSAACGLARGSPVFNPARPEANLSCKKLESDEEQLPPCHTALMSGRARISSANRKPVSSLTCISGCEHHGLGLGVGRLEPFGFAKLMEELDCDLI